MAVEGEVVVVKSVEVKRGEPVPAHVVVGDVVVVQPDHGGPKFGMPHAEVTVSALSSEWPFPMCLSCLLPDRCTRDQGLCCYACWCVYCAHAEVAEQNDIRGLLGQKEWYKQCCAVCCAEAASRQGESLCGSAARASASTRTGARTGARARARTVGSGEDPIV